MKELKMALILSGDINLNPESVTRHQINDPKFEAFNNGLHFIKLSSLTSLISYRIRQLP